MSDSNDGGQEQQFVEAHVVLDLRTFELAVKSGDPLVKQTLDARLENLNRKVEELSKGIPPADFDSFIQKKLSEKTQELDKAQAALADVFIRRVFLEKKIEDLEDRLKDKDGLSTDERELFDRARLVTVDLKRAKDKNEELITGVRVIDERVGKLIGVASQLKDLPKTGEREFRIKRIGEQINSLLSDPYFKGVAERSRN